VHLNIEMGVVSAGRKPEVGCIVGKLSEDHR